MKKFIAAIAIISTLSPLFAGAQVMASGAYGIQSDSVNFGGGQSSSASYGVEDTAGEAATGPSGSANFNLADAGFQGQGVTDAIAPTAPANLVATALTSSRIELTWDASTDNVGVSRYLVYRDGVRIRSVASFPRDFVDTGLAAETTHVYEVSAVDGAGNESAPSAQASAKTLAAPVAAVSSGGSSSGGLSLTSVNIVPSDTKAIISFSTSALASATVVATQAGKTVTVSDAAAFDHHITLAGLLPGTLYTLRITITTPVGSQAIFENLSFRTILLPSLAQPTNVTDFAATAREKDIALSWKLPEDPNVVGVWVVRSEKFYPADPGDGEIVFENGDASGVQSATDASVVPGRTYYYAVFTHDLAGTFSSGVVSQAAIALPGEPAPIITPIASLPIIGSVDPMIQALSLQDFLFVQDGDSVPLAGDSIQVNGNKEITVAVPYFHLPPVLKTVAVTLTRPGTGGTPESFTFILRANHDKTRYEATIGALGVGSTYTLQVTVLDFKNEGLKKLTGTLVAANGPLPAAPAAHKVFTPIEREAGLGLLVLIVLLLLAGLAIKRRRLAPALLALFLIYIVGFGQASQAVAFSANPEINYQGRLVDNANAPVADGSYNIRFKLYTAPSGGSPIWAEEWSGGNQIPISSGLFSTMLGSLTSLAAVNFNQTLYLSVEIGGTAVTPVWDGEMTPRKVLGSVPAAFVADTLDGLDSTQFLRSDTSGILSGNLTVSGNATVTNATTTRFAITGLGTTAGAFLAVDQNGTVIATTTPAAGSSASSTLLADNNTFSGNNIFSSLITGSVSGNAGTATKLQTARNINGVAFDGTGSITITAASSTLLANNNTFSGNNSFTNLFANTANLTESGNLFYTQARFDAALAATTTLNNLSVLKGVTDLIATRSTTTNATTTNFFATTASSTNLFSANATLGALTATTFSGAGLTNCTNPSQALTWNSGMFGCTTITGGSAGTGGTFSTTTSQVAGEFINFPNNSSDVVAIGSNATTSAKFYFDPNTSAAFLTAFSATNSTTTNATTTSFAITSLGTPAGSFLAVNANGTVIATTTPATGSSASSTLLADNNSFTGLDTFSDLKLVTRSTTTNATTTNFFATTASSTNLFSSLLNVRGGALVVDGNGSVGVGAAPTDHFSIATGGLSSTLGFGNDDGIGDNYINSNNASLALQVNGATKLTVVTAGVNLVANAAVHFGDLTTGPSITDSGSNVFDISSNNSNAAANISLHNRFTSFTVPTQAVSPNAAFGFNAAGGVGAGGKLVQFQNNGASYLVVDNVGNVGIASSTPNFTLSVDGKSSLGNSATAGFFTATTTSDNALPHLVFTSATGTSATTTNLFSTTGVFTNLFANTANLTESGNLFYTQARFDAALAATTTLNNLSVLKGVTDLIATRSTTTNATTTNFFATTASSTNLYSTSINNQSISVDGFSDDLHDTISSPRTYYVCSKANGGNCTFNGDSGTVAAVISDSNDCTTKSTPCRTLTGVKNKLAGKKLNAIVTIFLAETANTGTDCYQEDNLTFQNTSAGRQIIANGRLDTFPSSYLYIVGSTTAPTAVTMAGSSCGSPTLPSVAPNTTASLIADGSLSLRVNGIQFEGYGNLGNGGMEGAVTATGGATIYVENSSLIGNVQNQAAAKSGLAVAFGTGSSANIGQKITVNHGAGALVAADGADAHTYDPSNTSSNFTNVTYTCATGETCEPGLSALGGSRLFEDRITYNVDGGGTFVWKQAYLDSMIEFAEAYTQTGDCPSGFCFNGHFNSGLNAANYEFEDVGERSYISSECTNSLFTSCTVAVQPTVTASVSVLSSLRELSPGAVFNNNYSVTSGSAVSIFNGTRDVGSFITDTATTTSATTTNFAITGLGAPAGAFLAVNANGTLIATTTPASASSTLLTDNNTFSGANIFNNITRSTTTSATTTNFFATTASSTSLFASTAKIGSNALVVNSSGNVGINVAVPTKKLDVGGDINIGATNSIYTGGIASFTASSTNSSTQVGLLAGGALSESSLFDTFLGFETGLSNGGADYNTGLGFESLFSNTADHNTGVGAQAGFSNTTGTNNVFVGFNSGELNTTGTGNALVGYQAGFNNGSATSTTALGFSAASGATNYNAQNLTAIGYQSLANIITGANDNTALGYQAGLNVSSGARNILLGSQAGTNLTTGSNNIVIGYNINAPSVSSANTLNIGNILFGSGLTGSGSTIAGTIGIGTSTPLARLAVTGAAGQTSPLFQVASSTDSAFFTITNLGNVGVGTTTPSTPLYVQGSSNQLALATFSSPSNNGATITLTNTDTSGRSYNILSSGSTNCAGAGFLVLAEKDSSCTGRVIISSSGQLMLGVTTAANKLDVGGGAAIGSFAGVNVAPSNSLIISGNLGVGTSTPNWSLEVASTTPSIDIMDTDGAANAKHLLLGYNGGSFTIGTSTDALDTTSTALSLAPGTSAQLGIGTSTPWGIFSEEMTSANPAFVISHSGSSTPALYIGGVNQNGNIGIGTSNPNFTLEINGTASTTKLFATAATTTSATSTSFFSTTGAFTNLFGTTANLTESTNLFYTQARFDAALAATTTLSNLAILKGVTDLIATRATTTNATTTNFFATTASSTNLFTSKIGVATSTPWRTLSVTGTVGFDGLTTDTADSKTLCLTANNEVVANSGTSCITSSERFKNSITPLDSTSGLAELNQLTPVSFQYNSNIGIPGTQVGFIAEDVDKIDPRLVVFDASNAPFSVKYENLTAILAKSVQELDAKVNALASSTPVAFSSDTTNLLVSAIGLNLASSTDGLTINKQVVMNGGLRVDHIDAISDLISLDSDVNFIGRPYFNSDTGGLALVEKGSRQVDISFDKPYIDAPVVNATLSLDASSTDAEADNILASGTGYAVTKRSAGGFSILLSRPAPETMTFSWMALAIKNIKISDSAAIAQPGPISTVVEAPPVIISPNVPTEDTGSSTLPEITASSTPSLDASSTPPALVATTTVMVEASSTNP